MKKASNPSAFNCSMVVSLPSQSQQRGRRFGSHAKTLNIAIFKKFLHEIRGLDFDLMLEIKDKETSALKALEVLREFKKAG